MIVLISGGRPQPKNRTSTFPSTKPAQDHEFPGDRTPKRCCDPPFADSAPSRGGQQQAGGEAPVRPPALGEVCHLGGLREVVEAVARLDRVAQG